MSVPEEDLGPNYPVLVSFRNGEFRLRIKELALVARNSDIQRAYDELKRRRLELIEWARAAHAIDELPVPRTIQILPRPMSPRSTPDGRSL